MKSYKIAAELSLKNVIAETREFAQAVNEFADNLERIERKYEERQESEVSDAEGNYESGYNCGYADAMNDIAEREGDY